MGDPYRSMGTAPVRRPRFRTERVEGSLAGLLARLEPDEYLINVYPISFVALSSFAPSDYRVVLEAVIEVRQQDADARLARLSDYGSGS